MPDDGVVGTERLVALGLVVHISALVARSTHQERVDAQDAERSVAAWKHHAETIGLHRGVVGFWDTAVGVDRSGAPARRGRAAPVMVVSGLVTSRVAWRNAIQVSRIPS